MTSLEGIKPNVSERRLVAEWKRGSATSKGRTSDGGGGVTEEEGGSDPAASARGTSRNLGLFL